MAILEASGKQDLEGKDPQLLEEVRGAAPPRSSKGPRRERELGAQEDMDPQPLLPRVSQDLIALRLAQEKALKRQLEEEQKLKQQQQPPPRPAAPPTPLPAEEPMDFREEAAEAETPTIFISMQEEEESFGADSSLLDSSLEGPWPAKEQQSKEGASSSSSSDEGSASKPATAKQAAPSPEEPAKDTPAATPGSPAPEEEEPKPTLEQDKKAES